MKLYFQRITKRSVPHEAQRRALDEAHFAKALKNGALPEAALHARALSRFKIVQSQALHWEALFPAWCSTGARAMPRGHSCEGAKIGKHYV